MGKWVMDSLELAPRHHSLRLRLPILLTEMEMRTRERRWERIEGARGEERRRRCPRPKKGTNKMGVKRRWYVPTALYIHDA